MIKLAENNPQGTANIADDRVLAPVIKQMCKYCKKYKPIGRTNNGFNLQGDCELKGKVVWKDEYCTNHDYNGC